MSGLPELDLAETIVVDDPPAPSSYARNRAAELMFRGDRDSRFRLARRLSEIDLPEDRADATDVLGYRLARWLDWRHARAVALRRAQKVIDRAVAKGRQANPKAAPSERRSKRKDRTSRRRGVRFVQRVAALARSTDPDLLLETGRHLAEQGQATKAQIAYLDGFVKKLRTGEIAVTRPGTGQA